MGSRTAIAQHSGPVDTAGEKAYKYARSGVARSATTRSGYVEIFTSIDWIVRDNAGNIISTIDISNAVLLNTLRITQALNDEPDTCSLTLKPQEPPAAIPKVGQEIRITWAPGGPPLFHGYIVTSQSDWQLLNKQPPWIAVQCQDPMWRFDSRIVSYTFPAQSVTTSIEFLITRFCNKYFTPHPLDFTMGFVQRNMPTIPAFDVVNQRPSTVMRTLLAAVSGGFYIDGLAVHAWAGSVSEPNQTNPIPLTVGLNTLHTFRLTDDATQTRRRVLVEGRRTSTLIAIPETTAAAGNSLGVPVQDASIFKPGGGSVISIVRVGTQWMWVSDPVPVTANGAQPPQAKVSYAYEPGPDSLYLYLAPMLMMPPPRGWIRVGNQYSRYAAILGNPLTEQFRLEVVPNQAGTAYGAFTIPIPVGETVEWVDAVMQIYPWGFHWGVQDIINVNDKIYAHPTDSPIVTLAYAQAEAHGYGPSPFPEQIEGFVQDGRYSYAGAQARAVEDLDSFKDPLVTAEWETDDHNAIPGRSQVINLSSENITPPINRTVTILRVDISFPLRTLPPRRLCTGGVVKPSSFMDLVVTTNE